MEKEFKSIDYVIENLEEILLKKELVLFSDDEGKHKFALVPYKEYDLMKSDLKSFENITGIRRNK